jgi:Mannosyl-glycoprotein endo-beta-N-acetylglucosaminidase
MVTNLRGVSLVVLLWLNACSAEPSPPPAPNGPAPRGASATAPAEEWGCYDLKPDHPTASEQEVFIEEVARLATKAEDRYSVPAAALVAMAIAESGYGWTRLALNTNNLFAWKHFPGPATEGRPYWVLECQPDEPGTRFVVFADRAEAVDFVARQLAASDNYRADTERYRRDRAAEAVRAPLARLGSDQEVAGGRADVVEAVNRWVEGVADPYSSKPELWSRNVRHIMNDPYAPSERLSPERNLYRLSGLAPLPRDAAPAPAS